MLQGGEAGLKCGWDLDQWGLSEWMENTEFVFYSKEDLVGYVGWAGEQGPEW